MSDLAMSLLFIGGLGATLGTLLLLAVLARRHGTAGPALGAAMAAYDEAMHSTAYTSFVEVQAQDERKLPLTAADDL